MILSKLNKYGCNAIVKKCFEKNKVIFNKKNCVIVFLDSLKYEHREIKMSFNLFD